MSVENHPNLHAAGLTVDLYEKIEQRIRGEALAHKQMIMTSPRLAKMVTEFVERLETDIDQLVLLLK